MIHRFFFLFFILLCGLPRLYGELSFCSTDREPNLVDDLVIVNYWNQKLNEKFPVTYNHLLQGGYFSMPSARMGQEGEFAVGYGWIPPYIHYNLKIQLTHFLEISGNYRVFRGVADPVLTQFGFGDFSDKGANLKLSIFSAEDSRYRLPGFAVGLEDFMGTSAFKAYYAVLTQVFLQQNMEISVGYGAERIHGWFGGMTWLPFRKTKWDYLKNLAFVMEYDAIPYHDENLERHPKGRVKKTPWQIGAKYRLWDSIDCSCAYIRGHKWAFTASTYYNFGSCTGFLPKINEVKPYTAPLNLEPIGCLRTEKTLAQDLFFAMNAQGFDMYEVWLSYEGDRTILRLIVSNLAYRNEEHVRCRLNHLLASLIPETIDEVIVTMDTISTPIQEYHFQTSYLQLFRIREIGKYELKTLTPLLDATVPNPYTSTRIFKEEREWWNLEILPKTNTLFGSSRGKFKYALGISTNLNGFIFDNIFYTVSLGYFFFSDIKHLRDFDRLNPSQIINVRSDSINFFRPGTVTLDEAYLEKVWNYGKGWFTKISLGYFEPMYGGIAGEWLYYPAQSQWAFGMDLALVKKRNPTGLGFADDIRKLHGFHPTYRKFTGSHCFFNVYYDWKAIELEFKTSVGKFLANDYGARFEFSRYFCSGLRVGFWYTYTNGRDKINHQTYHDKGVFFSVPLDIFYTHTSRSRWGYGMSAWSRDVGASAFTGTHLYDLINQERQ